MSTPIDRYPCSRCGRVRTRLIGDSVSPSLRCVHCDDCGHTTGAALSRREATSLVRALVRDVMTEFGVRSDGLAVRDAYPDGYRITLRGDSQQIMRFRLPAASLPMMRATILAALEARVMGHR